MHDCVGQRVSRPALAPRARSPRVHGQPGVSKVRKDRRGRDGRYRPPPRAALPPERGWRPRTLPPRDRVSSVFFAGNTHDENQPVHLHVADTSICVDRCTREFGNPCQNFCPAGVYEMVEDGQRGRRLQINAANCVHCKACDIKDPYEIITWTTPEGGSGPNYQML